MMAFHTEFTFLVRSFFFVVLGLMAQWVSKSYILPIIAIVVALLVARYVSVYMTRWSIRGARRADNELLFLMLPRGLITAVLALQILAARGADFNFLPAMAFTVVLVTNVFVIVAAMRMRKAPGTEAPAAAALPNEVAPALPLAAEASAEAAES